jgi:nitrogen PTS system EIIA component
MLISKLVHPARIACRENCTSKKRSLEVLSKLLADATPDLTEGEIFDSLIGRERLGSTGLGKGVALPHGRIQGISQPLGALLTLTDGIEFDAIDNQPVDLLFALLVPAESTDEHLQILAQLAERFSQPVFCEKLRAAEDSDTCAALFRPHDQQSMSA